MKQLFDELSVSCSKMMTRKYSTSFSLGISLFAKKFHTPVYAVYGFVRLADEIVDSFHEYDKQKLLTEFKQATDDAIKRRISLNPVLNSFQEVVHEYKIEDELIRLFLNSMSMDLEQKTYSEENYKTYILGSAEVVGLMCLRIFSEGNEKMYEELKPYAMKLGSAFQKVNFLRDIRADYEHLGRIYFPGIDLRQFSQVDKRRIEEEIDREFSESLKGIRMLPAGARCGVYLAYRYYRNLFSKIKSISANDVMKERIRISNGRKFGLMVHSMVLHRLNAL